MKHDDKFFPIPSSTKGLWIATGEINRLGGRESMRNEPRWREIGTERDKARTIVETWRDAAIADGWTFNPTYAHEDVNRAMTLQILLASGLKIGTTSLNRLFKTHVISRPNVLEGKDWSLGDGTINVFGPDDLQIKVPLIYPGKQYFVDALVTCQYCGNGPNRHYFKDPATGDYDLCHPVATYRFSFAGRACRQCIPELQKVHERPGWND